MQVCYAQYAGIGARRHCTRYVPLQCKYTFSGYILKLPAPAVRKEVSEGICPDHPIFPTVLARSTHNLKH